MAKRVNRQLKKAKEEEKSLEEELEKLKNGTDPKDSCVEVIKFVESTSMDPMPDSENNPFVLQNCFVAGTEIMVTKSGQKKRIEEMQIGDQVMCLVNENENENENELFKGGKENVENIPNLLTDAIVIAIHNSLTHDICRIQYRNQSTNEETTIECTDSHPIYVYKEGWKSVSGKENNEYELNIKPLKEGDQVCLESGQLANITFIHRTHFQHPITVYNLTVSNGHTFFANGLFVHNKGCCVIL